MKKTAIIKAGIVLAACSLLGGCSPKKESESTEQDKIILTYANWNLGTESEKNLERLMIEEFNKSHDKISVKIDDTIDGDDYNGKMNTAASAGKLPDVFMLNNIPTSYKNEWLLDLEPFIKEDNDFSEIDETIKQTLNVNEEVVALPFAKHLMGYFVNNDLLNQLNLDIPEPGIEIEAFIETVKKATDINKGYVGIESTANFVDWYAGEKNDNLGWYAFNDGEFNLDSDEMIQGIQEAKNLTSGKYTYVDLTDEQKANIGGEDSGAAFKQGHIAFYYNGSYMTQSLQKESDIDFSFIGTPGSRNAMTLDYIGVSKNTKNAEAAYEFAKYMSFGKEGFLKRIELSEQEGLELATLPLTTNKEVSEKYWENVTVDGLEEVNDNLENAMFDPLKVVPGYVQARFEGETGLKVGDKENANVWELLEASIKGDINYQDYASQLQKLAQSFYEDALNSMNDN